MHRRCERSCRVHQRVLAVRVRADRLCQPRRRRAGGDLGLERSAAGDDDEADGVESSEQPRSVIPDKLEQFGLPGFEIGEDGRIR